MGGGHELFFRIHIPLRTPNGTLQLDIVRIFAEPFAYNTGSRKSLEKAGYQLEGVMRKSIYKNGNIYDSCIYSLIK